MMAYCADNSGYISITPSFRHTQDAPLWAAPPWILKWCGTRYSSRNVPINDALVSLAGCKAY